MKPIIDKEFKALIPPLSSNELAQLEANILADGCRDPLVVWDEENILLDGHHRLEICERHNLDFKVVRMHFNSRDDAADWIDANQIGRRNLTPDMMSLIRGRCYNRAKKEQGGTGANQHTEQRVQNEPSAKTADFLAARFGVSASTIKRDAKFAEEVERNPALKEAVMNKVPIAKATQLIKKEENGLKLREIGMKEPKTIAGLYDVVVLDPPWPMEKIVRDVRPNQVGFDYPTMTVDEILDIRIPASANCHVWLWTTHRFLPLAFKLINNYGTYVCTFVWHKPGGFQPLGLPQYNCEFCLYARHGTPKFIDTKAFSVCFNAKRGEHSEKPQEFYDMIRRVTDGRRIDMFNRRRIEGFDGWGKEACQNPGQ